MYKVISVDYNLDSDKVVNLQFNSPNSFLDADILLLNPVTQEWVTKNLEKHYKGYYQIKYRRNPDVIIELYNKRRYEIEKLMESGKIIIVLMAPLFTFQVQTGHDHFGNFSNYHWLPYNYNKLPNYIFNGSGSSIVNDSNKTIFDPLYKAFKEEFNYHAYFSESFEKGTFKFDKSDFVLRNNTGNIVGFSKKCLNGIITFMPYLKQNFNPEKLIGVMLQCAKPYLSNNIKTPEPEWGKEYIIPGENEIKTQIEHIQTEINKQNEEMEKVITKEKELLEYRGLLYEQGKPLENSVIKAFQLMGFSVDKYELKDMEHDIVLECDEGRIIGEIEGKDTDAINISKLDQLSRVVDEDFHRNGKYPDGILIGNAYRLFKPEDRPSCFTDKVLIAAERKGFGLLNTVELFNICIRLLENSEDAKLKKDCRQRIFTLLGSEITFN